MAFPWFQKSQGSLTLAAQLHSLCREAQDVGVRDGLTATPCADYPATRRVETERAARDEAEVELGPVPALPTLRAAALSAGETLTEAQRDVAECEWKPLDMQRRLLLGLGVGLLAVCAALALSAGLYCAGTCAAAAAALTGLLAQSARGWLLEFRLRAARREERMCRVALAEAEERSLSIAERATALAADSSAQLALAYRRGYQKGTRYLAVGRGATDHPIVTEAAE